MNEEQQLIDKARAGDQASLSALIAKYWNAVFRLACRRTGCSEDAQEIAQDTFLKALRALPGYRHTGASFNTYLSKIALNVIIDYWRKKGRSPQLTTIADYGEPLADPAQLPEERTLTRERQETIARLVAMLPPEQRQAIELRIFASLSVQESARLMGKSEPALKMLQQRALKNLRRLFVENGIVG